MKNLIIVGAGGFGREALYLAKDIIKQNNLDYNILGFIDDNDKALEGVNCDYHIIGKISNWIVKDNEVFVIGISNPSTKEKVVTLMKSKGAKFISLIHPAALINEKAQIGEGCIISCRSSVGDCAVIGDFVNLAGCMAGQDSVIGDFSTITGYVNVTTAKLGKRVFVGSHSVILNDLKIGDDVFICAGSIVFSNIKSGKKVLGYPAKKIDI